MMHDSFEYREDFVRAQASANCPVMLCPVKWQAAKLAIETLRVLNPRHPTVAVCDQVGLTFDFEPSLVGAEI